MTKMQPKVQPSQIAVVEPQMEDLFHAPFNAALLHAVALAYPENPVSFQASPAHARIVRNILDEHAPTLAQRIDWRVVPLPSAKSALARFLETRTFIRRAASSADRVLFSSISRMQLLHLKRFLRGHPRHQVRAILHGDLDRTTYNFNEAFPMSLFPIERVLKFPHPANLRYMMLSESIRRNLPPDLRQALSNPGAIDHPYHFPPVRPSTPGELIFGVFGNSGEGYLLEKVARSVKAIDPSVRFRLVGFLSGKEPVERLSPFVEDVTDVPISRETFVERAHEITHSLWLTEPEGFRLRASGTFFDTLAYAKPIIYTANSYIDPYYALEPKIGTRAETIDAVANAVLNTIRAHTPAIYAEAQQAMQRLRLRFTPQEQAKTLPAALDW